MFQFESILCSREGTKLFSVYDFERYGESVAIVPLTLTLSFLAPLLKTLYLSNIILAISYSGEN